ncbi:MAG: ATP-binding protein [Planctomycetes bacterium]|nr:ATP-binding protein [Planctomycetota bacterium]
MNARPFWLQLIEDAWRKRPIVWLSGVRRVGKTTLARMLPDVTYMNCDLPSACRALAEPEFFFDGLPTGSRVVLDEVHRLEDPSRVLKIAADAYPHLRVLATGSSTLAATRKFRDALTGRKVAICLTPVLWTECQSAFGIRDLDRRLLHGGLPEPLLAAGKDPAFFAEWADSFYARDIQELFAIRNRAGFLKILHLVLRQSGGMLDYSSLAALADVSRPTAKAHVEALAIAHAAFLLPPFHGGGRRELTRRPKCYAFDTGFATFARGWDALREEDRGPLWEHLVLDALRAAGDGRGLYFWRDKSGREVDFVVKGPGGRLDAIECKIDPDRFDAGALAAFRADYPEGDNLVLSPWVKTPYERLQRGLRVRFGTLDVLPWLRDRALLL